MNKLFVILILLVCHNSLLAQQSRLVYGRVLDTNNTALFAATIKLYIPGINDTLNTVSANNGYFQFSKVASSKFVVIVSSVGYSNFKGEYNFSEAEMDIELKEMLMSPFVDILQEVVVRNSPAILVKIDTIEYKVDSFKVKSDAVVEDLLKKLPGVQVDKNGVVTAHGKRVNRIKINGKDFFRGNIKAATQDLPANLIDKVQVIDDFGDVAAFSGIKDGEPDKVINLQFKKDNTGGFIGKAEAGYGSANSYKASLSTNYFNEKSQISVIGKSNNINNGFQVGSNNGLNTMMMGHTGSSTSQTNNNSASGLQQPIANVPQGITTSHAVGTNFRFDFGKNNSFYGSYDYANRNTYGFSEILHQSFYPSGNFINNQQLESYQNGNSHQGYLNIELYPDSLSYIKVSPTFSYNKSRNINATIFDVFKETFKTSEGYTRDTTTNRIPDLGFDILFNRGFKKRGRNLSVTLNMNGLDADVQTYSPAFTRTFDTLGGFNEIYQKQKINQDNTEFIYNVYFAYTEPFAKDKYIDITYFNSVSKSNNERRTFQNNPVGGPDSLLSALSNDFTSIYTNERLGLNFRTVKKKYNYSLGISLLPVSVKNFISEKDRDYTLNNSVNISPFARFASNFSKSRSVGVTYTGNIRRPSSLQLQPVKDISNPQFQYEGNPELNPEMLHNISLTLNSFNVLSGSTLFSGLNIRGVQNQIVENVTLLDSNGAQLKTPQNVNGGYSAVGFYSLTKPFQLNKYLFRFNGSVNYDKDPVLINSKRANNSNWFISQEFSFTFNNRWFEMNVGANYILSSTHNKLNQPTHINFNSWVLSHDLRIDLPGKLLIKYNVEYVMNNGLNASFQKSIILMNSTIEKKILKSHPVYFSVAAYNIFDQNSSFTRQFSANSFLDIRALQLNRYFLATFRYQWRNFRGKGH